MSQESVAVTETHASSVGAWGGAFKAIGQVFEQVRKNPEPTLVVLGVYAGLMILSLVLLGKPTKETSFRFEDLTTLLFLLAMPTYALALADKRKITISEFMRFDASKYFIVLAVAILYGLIVFGSALLLIFPIIWTLAWYFVSTLVAVDKGVGPIEALKASKQLTQSHKGKVWGIFGACIVLLIVTIPFQLMLPFVGQLVGAFVGILIGGASAILYRWLEHNKTV
jgi:hypothetical protein